MDGDTFSEGKQYALDRIGKRNTIILAGSNPYVVLENGGASEARRVIKDALVHGERSALADAFTLAGEKLSGDEQQLVIVSDFLDTEGGDVTAAFQTFGDDVSLAVFPTTSMPRENVGIIDLGVSDSRGTVTVKNFCCATQEIPVTLSDRVATITLDVGETERLEFPLTEERVKVSLPGDSFPLDDIGYVSNPSTSLLRVLLLTQDASPNLKAALQASPNIALDVKSPGSLSDTSYDVIVLHNVEELRPKVVETLKQYLAEGYAVVVHAEETLSGDYGGLLPFTLGESLSGGASAIVQDARFTNKILFGRIDPLRTVTCGGDCLGAFITVKDTPLVMVQSSGAGRIGYFGILEEASGFKDTPDYEISLLRQVTVN